jgi:ubiquinone/menaquinone biosynthesis C-methylase UbiE
MSDIDLYSSNPAHYEDIQMLRPDYASAKTALLDLALTHLGSRKGKGKAKKGIVLADFCCGTGLNTKMLADRLPVARAVLIDHNAQFISMAMASQIAAEIEPVVGDILETDFPCRADAVLSMFAYHHMEDGQKMKYLEQVKKALMPGGLLFLGEIYLADKQMTRAYYQKLYAAIPEKSEELQHFLSQTAESDAYEYKVTKAFADAQLHEAGFELVESRKIWPTDNAFGKDAGTYVEVWRVK